MLALSTRRQPFLAQSGLDLVEFSKSHGFNFIELGYRVSHGMFLELKRAMPSRGVRPLSIRNYFPAPEVTARPGSEVWAFSAPDPEERASAVDYTRRGIEAAGELGAQFLVLHCGKAHIEPRSYELRRFYDEGRTESARGQRLIGSISAQRKKVIGGQLDFVSKCLEELVGPARRAGLKLALENRVEADEIPSSEDLAVLFSRFNPEDVGYWHNISNSIVQENLGLSSQVALLGRFRDRAVGVNLSDASGHECDLFPGAGQADFAFIRENLPQNIAGVLDFSPGLKTQPLRDAVEYLDKVGFAKCG